MKKLLKKYNHACVLLYALIYLPWFRFLEEHVTDDYAVMHVTLDDRIPFEEVFVVPYLLWFVYVASAGIYYFLTSREDFYRLATFLIIGMTASLIICTFFPNGTDLRRYVDPDKNIFCALVRLVRGVDTPTNVFPSIHVYNSLGVHFSVASSRRLRGKRWLRLASFVLMVLICLSTMFLKQHSVVDVIGAVIMAGIVYPMAFSPAGADSETEHQKAIG